MNISQRNWTCNESIQNWFNDIQNVTFWINLSEGIESGSFLNLSFPHELMTVTNAYVEVNGTFLCVYQRQLLSNKHY